MLLLFAAVPALVPARQRPVACRRRRAGSRPLPVSVHPCLPSSSPPLPPMAADAPGRSLPSAAALAVPPPHELSLSRRSPFRIAVVDAATAADNDGDRIPPPRSKLRRRLPPPSTSSSGAATIIVATKLGGPVGLPPPFFYFGGKLKIPKSEKREEKETDHGLTTPPFPSLSFFNAR